MRFNVKTKPSVLRTHEGGPAIALSESQELRRSVMATLLWEHGFYENGEAIADRISRLARAVGPQVAATVLREAKFEQKLRHAPLWMAVAMARSGWLTKDQLAEILTRPDDVTEFLALYWAEGKCPVGHQIRKGIARALTRFDEYQLAKNDRDASIRLRDAFRVVRPVPADAAQSDLWRRTVHGGLAVPDTWETALSSGADKKSTFERLLRERKLGDLAFVRNLRNMVKVDVDHELIKESFATRQWMRMLPFQFVTAARMVPSWEPELEAAMLKSMSGMEKFPGRTVIMVDGSGSMAEKLSAKSDTTRFDAACGLAILARELCEDVEVWRFNDTARLVPARHGFALRDALGKPGGGTRMWDALRAAAKGRKRDLVIVATDEQTADSGSAVDANSEILAVVNVAANMRGVGYGEGIVHVDGWSENVVSYLRNYTQLAVKENVGMHSAG